MEARRIIKALLLSASSLLLSSSYAASPGIFIGGGIGHGKIETPDDNIFNNAVPAEPETNNTVNKTIYNTGGLAGTVFLGFNFSKYFGIEASFNQFATSEYESNQSAIDKNGVVATASSKIDFRAHSYNLVGRGYWSFDNGIEIFGRGGVAYVFQSEHYISTTDNAPYDIDVNNGELATPDNGNTNTHKFRPTAGVGIGYHFNPKIGIGFAWNYIFGDGNLKTDKHAIASLQMVTFDMSYTFA